MNSTDVEIYSHIETIPEENYVKEVEPPTPHNTPKYKNLVDMTYDQLEKELEKMCDLNIVISEQKLNTQTDNIKKNNTKTNPSENLKLKMIEGIISGFKNLETTINKFDSIKYYKDPKKMSFI